MYNIKLMNKITPVGTNEFDRERYIIGEKLEAADAIMVRSASLLEEKFNPELRAIARCGAGYNNIPTDRCADDGIVVFNTPGANANGVKELAIAALLLASRGIVAGIEWTKTLAGTESVAKAVEAGKGKFVGCEIEGKTLGVIGLGAVGGMVANAARALGMEVVGFDPYISVDAAWGLSRAVRKAAGNDEVYAAADYISIHAPATPETKNMINAETLSKMKDGVRIINLSRADLINAADMKAALESGKVACYVTDFPTEDTVGVPGIIAIPHLGASTEESEDNCAVMAARQIIDYLENGNIVNSVNYPAISLPRTADHRICILHKNIPNMLSHISGSLAAQNINIENMINKSRGNYAVTIVDTKSPVDNGTAAKIASVEGIIRVINL